MQKLCSSSDSRTLTPLIFSLSCMLLIAPCAFGQDPGAIAAQQAAIEAQQAAMQAQIQAQQAQVQQAAATAASQQAAQAAANASQNVAAIAYATPPTFSVKSGTISAGTQVRLETRTHYATIYYTTNGWTPTASSKRYTGPITISRTTEFKAIAIAPNLAPSAIASSTYTVAGTSAGHQYNPLSTDGVLYAGTPLHLLTADSISSKTAKVGDPIKIALDQDIKVGDNIVIPKGTLVAATITVADHSGHAGAPGDLAFEVHSIDLNGKSIPLTGGETLEGRNHYGRNSLVFVPVVGVAGLALHGDEAQITPGMTLSASVAQDTTLQP
jgi:hypothetical protein